MQSSSRNRSAVSGILLFVLGLSFGQFGSEEFVPAASAVDQCNGLVATIVGTSNGETINGTNGDDVIVGLGGNDTINGLNGNDTICGGDGNDTINGGNGNDWIDGEEGNDTIDAGNDNDTIYGGNGDDELEAGNGNDSLFGGAGMDSLDAEGGDDAMDGGADTDTCDGGTGTDSSVNCENGPDGTGGGSSSAASSLVSSIASSVASSVASSTVSSIASASSDSSDSSASSASSIVSSVTSSSSSFGIPGCGCPEIPFPVCGTDGNTYTNACLAVCAGAGVQSIGMCAISSVSSSSIASSVTSSNASTSSDSSASSIVSSVASSSAPVVTGTAFTAGDSNGSTGGNDGESGSYRGWRTNAINGIATFLQYMITGNDLAPAAFGGSLRAPLSDIEKNYVCSILKATPADTAAGMQDWLAKRIADALNRDATFIARILEEGNVCPSLEVAAPAPVVAAAIPFEVDIWGVPVSSNPTWNKCIRGSVTLQDIRSNPDKNEDGIPLSCASYHTQESWYHPDLKEYFTYNRFTHKLGLPNGYALTQTEFKVSLK